MSEENNSKSYEDYVKNKGEKRSNPLNKGVEKPEPSEELLKILKEESKKG